MRCFSFLVKCLPVKRTKYVFLHDQLHLSFSFDASITAFCFDYEGLPAKYAIGKWKMAEPVYI